MCYEKNSVHTDNKVVSHFPARMHDNLDNLAKTIMNADNCRSFAVSLPAEDNSCFTTQEPVLSDSYVRHLTILHFPLKTGYHRFDYPLCRPV